MSDLRNWNRVWWNSITAEAIKVIRIFQQKITIDNHTRRSLVTPRLDKT